MQLIAPNASWCWPLGHGAHVLDDWPFELLNFPYVQAGHELAPEGALAYFPATQVMHVFEDCRPALLCLPAAQLMHEVAALVLEAYWPATQVMHVSADCAAEALYFPAAQESQSVSASWFAEVLYLPAGQLLQELASLPEYVPAAQESQEESWFEPPLNVPPAHVQHLALQAPPAQGPNQEHSVPDLYLPAPQSSR